MPPRTEPGAGASAILGIASPGAARIPLADVDRINQDRARAIRAAGAICGRPLLQGEEDSLTAMIGDCEGTYRGLSRAGSFGRYRVWDAESGRRVPRQGTVILLLDPESDAFATYQGPLSASGEIADEVRCIGLLVPGTGSRLETWHGDLGRTKGYANASASSTAYITWHGAPLPQNVTRALSRRLARVAAPRLVEFVRALRRRTEAEITAVGHSYGALIVARAERAGLDVDRVVYAAPAGLGVRVRGPRSFGVTGIRPHFVVQARRDRTVGSGQAVRWHGRHPLRQRWITRLESGVLRGLDGGETNTHMAVFEYPGNVAGRNIIAVIEGRNPGVSLFVNA